MVVYLCMNVRLSCVVNMNGISVSLVEEPAWGSTVEQPCTVHHRPFVLPCILLTRVA